MENICQGPEDIYKKIEETLESYHRDNSNGNGFKPEPRNLMRIIYLNVFSSGKIAFRELGISKKELGQYQNYLRDMNKLTRLMLLCDLGHYIAQSNFQGTPDVWN